MPRFLKALPSKAFLFLVVHSWCMVVVDRCISGGEVVYEWCTSGGEVVVRWCIGGVRVVHVFWVSLLGFGSTSQEIAGQALNDSFNFKSAFQKFIGK